MGKSPSWIASPESWDTFVIAGKTFVGPVECTFRLGRRQDVKQSPGLNDATVTDTGTKATEVSIRFTLFTEAHWAFYTDVLVPLVSPKLPAPPATSSAPANGIPENFFVRTPYGPGYTEALQDELLVNQPAFALAVREGFLVTDVSGLADAQAKAARERALAPVSVYHPALAGAGIRQLRLRELSEPRSAKQGMKEVTLTGYRFSPKRDAGVSTPKASAPDSGLSGIRLAPELRDAARPSTTDGKP